MFIVLPLPSIWIIQSVTQSSMPMQKKEYVCTFLYLDAFIHFVFVFYSTFFAFYARPFFHTNAHTKDTFFGVLDGYCCCLCSVSVCKFFFCCIHLWIRKVNSNVCTMRAQHAHAKTLNNIKCIEILVFW